MITNTPFSQTNPVATSPRNAPSLSLEITNINNELSLIEDTLAKGFIHEAQTISFISSSAFTVVGDQSTVYTGGRVLRLNNTIIAIVLNSSFNSGTGLTTVNTVTTVVPSPLTSVDFSLQPKGATNPDLIGTNIKAGVFTRPQVLGSFQALTNDTDAATVTFDMAASNIHTEVLGGNRTFAVANVVVGQAFIVRVVQPNTGGPWTPTWFAGIKWPSGVVPPVSVGANKTDVFGFLCTANGVYDGYFLGFNL